MDDEMIKGMMEYVERSRGDEEKRLNVQYSL